MSAGQFAFPIRTSVISRRSILRTGLFTGAATICPSLLFGQAASRPDSLAQMRAPAAKTPITTTRLYDNLFLLQGEGGNMAAQIGPDGKVLIDSSYQPAVPKILDVLNNLSKDPNDALINTH